MKKRLFSLLAMLLVLIMLFSACSQTQTQTEAPAQTEAATQTTAPVEVESESEEAAAPVAPEDRVIVKYWCPHGSGTSTWIDENVINAFNESQDKYWVVREYNGGYYDQLAKLQSTEQKDLPAFVNSSSETVGSYLHSGLIIPIQNFIDADSTYEDPSLYGNLVATYGIDGELIGYPEALSLSGFFYNKSVFEAAGIDPYSLTSMDAVYAAVEKICTGGHAEYGIAEEHSGIWANYAFHREGFYTVDNENGKTGLPTKCLYDDNSNGFADIVTKYYTHWSNIAANGYLYPFGAEVKEELIPALASGKLAMLVTTNSYQANMKEAFAENPDGYGFVPMFSVTDDGKQTGYCSSGQGFFMIDNGDPEAQQGAWEYIKFFCSAAVQTQWNIRSGYLPICDAVYNDAEYQAYLADYPYVQTLIDAMKNSDLSAFYAFTATNNTYSPAGATCLEAVINGTPVADAIAQMCQTINDDFEIYNATNQ